MPGGVGGAASRGAPLSRSMTQNGPCLDSIETMKREEFVKLRPNGAEVVDRVAGVAVTRLEPATATSRATDSDENHEVAALSLRKTGNNDHFL